MSPFRWTPLFATGLGQVDAQHRQLIALISELSTRLERSEVQAESLAALLSDLLRYVDEHTRTEGRLLEELGVDPRHVQHHMAEHHYLEEQIQEMVRRPSAPAERSAQLLLDFLIHWVTYHILGTDQAMARQVKAIRAGRSPADAFQEDGTRDADPATATLLHSVHALLEILSLRNRELTEVTESLERRVLERTRELSASNAELKRVVAEVERVAMTDFLTGLPNRRHAIERFAKIWALSVRHQRPLSCLLIDADGFKEVNDAHGHHAGDEVLKALAAALRGAVRIGDELSRFGGDEFLLIAPETLLSGALTLGERIRASIAQLRVPAGQGVWGGSISVGVATRLPGEMDPEALLRLADRGLYAAKRAGRNAVRAGGEERASDDWTI